MIDESGFGLLCCMHVENTDYRPITEVKQRWARLALGWVTVWEHRVLLAGPIFNIFNFL
jgi:hypothetical protein